MSTPVGMRVHDYAPPSWPDGPPYQQMHIDVAVDDLDAAVTAAVALGATEAAVQPAPQQWRVLLDPVGHPFCLSTVRPN
jgi:Glyoxalase-like domain